LAEETILSDEFLRQLINVGEVDILVGLPTHNNGKTIGPVIHAIQAGILKCFPRERAVIINADGGSQDETPKLALGASIDDVWSASKVYALRTLHAISTQYARSPDPGLALRTILAAAELLRAKACVLISPESTTIEPDWLQRLTRPVYDNFDLVCPLYTRSRFDGVLMRNLLYPVVRAAYGVGLREPFATEFAVSGRLACDFLDSDIWTEEWGRSGPEIALTVKAITGKYRICQSFLGPKAPPAIADVVAAMRRTVGALFGSLGKHFDLWSATAGSQPAATLGTWQPAELEPMRVDRERLRQMFASGVAQLDSVFHSILSPAALAEMKSAAALELGDFRYPDDLWIRTVFEFAAAYHKSVISRDHILQALVPLYRGRTLAFLLKNQEANAEAIENGVESLCVEFERRKPRLLALWGERK
jgi:hypothetical protein